MTTLDYFRDRYDAGRQLARELSAYAGRSDVLVLALPRGGVAVGLEVSRALGAPLDVLVVRKLGVPGHPELAMGAVAPGGLRVLNPLVVEALGIPQPVIDMVTQIELEEVQRRERLYRGDRPAPDVRGRRVIVVDDGLATGATMRAAIVVLRAQQPARIVIAVPVAPADIVDELRREADEVVCPVAAEVFWSIGAWYLDFAQLSDKQVLALLNEARRSRIARPA